MKKWMALVLALVMVLSLAACGSKKVDETTKAPDTKGTEKEETEAADTTAAKEDTEAGSAGDVNGDGKIIVGYIAKNTVDAFHATLNKTAEAKLDALVNEGTIDEWKMLDGQSDPIIQCNLLEDALNMGADLIVLLPAEAAGSAPILERCKEEGVPCLVVNSMTDNTEELATAFVGSDDVQAGEMMAEYVQSVYPEGGKYGHVQGVIGNSAQIQRSEGIHNILDADSKWEMLDEQSGEWQAEKAVKFAEDWLGRWGDDLTCIICEDDGSSAAVQTSMNSKGRTDMVCIGVNGEAAALDMIQKGEMQATIYQDGAGQVGKAIELIPDILSGKSVEKSYMIDFVLITKDNVEDYIQ
ncbi:substrate-binding domain-containing protein [Lacrimispora sp. NSJ-141]|uniref:Substrate-binding domain-containing protein n=1 Tax=Lientehia hominis TaxID=2897778 RepID=A0AAP2RJ08_9FIRM|nr:substrate-binding domain-containing protein [Lientehia hominis]MCD2492319.1 substrate-binding domain-containing protein [Lientehia hominis]